MLIVSVSSPNEISNYEGNCTQQNKTQKKTKGTVCFLETPEGAIGTTKQIPMYTYSIMLLYLKNGI